jgi:oligopeptide/dipeptide ABC transporter ATP-binding protein
MADRILQIKDLRTYFFTRAGAIKAVEGLSLALSRGETLALVGESGSGKSVTALSILRLVPPPGRIVSGQIYFEGEDLLKFSQEQMRRLRGRQIAMIFQDPMTSLNPVYTVGEQIAEAIRYHLGLERRRAWARAVELMERVRIPDAKRRAKNYPHELSGGMRQRAMIAMALCCNPKLLIADEPTTALDVTIQAEILDLLGELKRDFGLSMLLITHDLGIVAETANAVSVMYAGQIVEQAPTRELFSNPRHPYTEGLLNCLPRPAQGGAERRRLRAIEGSVPDLLNLPAGCSFAPRCSYAVEECRAREIPLLEVSDGHRSRCIRFDRVGDQSAMTR